MASRTSARRRGKSWLFGAACIFAAAGPPLDRLAAQAQEMGADAAAPESEAPVTTARFRPELLITPSLGLQESFTDNAGMTEENRRSDFVTRARLGLRLDLDHGPAIATFDGGADYDFYARSSGLNGWSFNAQASGAYALIRDRLQIEAEGNLSNTFVSTFQGTALDRSGAQGRTQLGVYYVGPKLTVPVADFADLTAGARIGQVLYSAANGSTVANLPSDSTYVQTVTRLDTGDRIRRYELVTAVQAEGDDHDYRSVSAVQSIFIRVAPRVRLIARAGYEHVGQGAFLDRGGELLSAGFELTPTDDSHVTLEGGTRYHQSAFAGSADVRLSNHFVLKGIYEEALTSDQLYVANIFADSVAGRGSQLPAPRTGGVGGGGFGLQDNLYNQTSYNKRADLHLTYDSPVQTFDAAAHWSDRHFLVSDTHDRSAGAGLTYTRRLRPDLDLLASADYSRTLASPLFGASETWNLRANLAYRINSTTDLTGGYTYRDARQTFVGGQRVTENAVMIALQKRF